MLTKETMNRRALSAEYAVRGPIVIRAQQLEEQGRKIVYCNIGNPQAFVQRPISFFRQMLSLLEFPELLNRPAALQEFPADVVERARAILKRHPPGTGAYTQSAGLPFIREAVAEFIRNRDGIPARKEHVILTDGASKGVHMVLTAVLREQADGIMIPIPQYPLYSATIALLGGKQVGYLLDEAMDWQLNESVLTSSLQAAKDQGIHPVALVVINPGNPTGGVLSEANIRMVVAFARRHGLCIIADEVYQENVYAPGARFHSFARVMHAMGETGVSLFSLHSVSKGFFGECGHRGGYLEIRNVPDDVLAEFIKLQSIQLCANVPGQIATYVMVTPPRPGEASHATYVQERDEILGALRSKAEILGRGINAIEGMSLVQPAGAMYGFVRFELPPEPGVDLQAMTPEARQDYEAASDTQYCMALLEETGICVVPGSGFGQQPGTMHFRTTFLPSQEEIVRLVEHLNTFHQNYTRKREVAQHAEDHH
jgi:aspartate/methionine/tyrosine aminotransferase